MIPAENALLFRLLYLMLPVLETVFIWSNTVVRGKAPDKVGAILVADHLSNFSNGVSGLC